MLSLSEISNNSGKQHILWLLIKLAEFDSEREVCRYLLEVAAAAPLSLCNPSFNHILPHDYLTQVFSFPFNMTCNVFVSFTWCHLSIYLNLQRN